MFEVRAGHGRLVFEEKPQPDFSSPTMADIQTIQAAVDALELVVEGLATPEEPEEPEEPVSASVVAIEDAQFYNDGLVLTDANNTVIQYSFTRNSAGQLTAITKLDDSTVMDIGWNSMDRPVEGV